MTCEFKITVDPPQVMDIRVPGPQTMKVSFGERGPAGEPGGAGPPGESGTIIMADAGAPTATANPGDLYIDTLTGDLYEWL
jgi:hypothetical protein